MAEELWFSWFNLLIQAHGSRFTKCNFLNGFVINAVMVTYQ